jgi:hypothetical protein
MQLTAVLLVLLFLTCPVAAAQKLALFDVELVNTSLEPTRPDEDARLDLVKKMLAQSLAEHEFTLVETHPVVEEVAKVRSLHECNGCELGLARKLNAELAAVAWVQKVSNLILNLNLQIREVGTGRLVHAGTVDIRGNNDESWRRGTLYLVNHRMFPKPQR